MAQYRAFTEGFDLYPGLSTAGFGVASTWLFSGVSNVSLPAGRFGGAKLLRSGGTAGTSNFQRPIPSTTQAVAGVAFQTAGSFETQWRFIQFLSTNGNSQIDMRVTNNGFLQVYAGGTLLKQSDSQVMTINSWHYLEMAVNLSDTTGSLRVWLNDFELPEFHLDNVDTKGHADPDIGRFAFVLQDRGAIDDMYCEVDGMTRIGEGRIFALPVNGDVSTMFAPSEGADNYANINQVPFNGTRYNQGAEVNDIDMFYVTDLPFVPEKIFGLQVTSLSDKDEAGTRAHVNRLLSGATLVEGAQFVETLNSSIMARDFYAVNPDTGLPWSIGGVNGVQIGYRISV